MSDVARQLKLLRNTAKLSVQQVADAMNMPKSTYAAYEDKFKREFIPMGLVNKLLPVFKACGISETEILALGGSPLAVETTSSAQPAANQNVSEAGLSSVRVVPDAPPMFTSKRDLPILGFTKGGTAGFFIDNGAISGMEYRPLRLVGVEGAYAVRVYGGSMSPRLEDGWLLYVNPRKELRFGKDVIIQYLDGQAIVKTLLHSDDTEIRVREYSPARKDFTIPWSDLKSVHMVVLCDPDA